MQLSAATVDDLMRKALTRLLVSRSTVPASRGVSTEIPAALLSLSNPRARLSRTENRSVLFSGLGELCWYLAGSNQLRFIEHYIPKYRQESSDGKTLPGAYGPRLLKTDGINQLEQISTLLRLKPTTRRAVIQIFDRRDIPSDARELPCTCTFQFLIRSRKLEMITTMRSNDAFVGLPHDFFTFTMLQEIVARKLGVEVGTYKHFVGSLHLYKKNFEAAQKYLDEGWQSTRPTMPPMPIGDPWPSINRLLKSEVKIRVSGDLSHIPKEPSPYWADLQRILAIFSLSKSSSETNRKKIRILRNSMHSKDFNTYIKKRVKKLEQAIAEAAIQLDLPGV